MKLLTIIGTRPEAIKMAPVLMALAARRGVASRICATGQHRDLFDEPLRFFGLAADLNLGLMRPGQLHGALMARAMREIDAVLATERPDRVIVHGDTSTALAGARAASARGIPVSHIEAGLRTYRSDQPWPEENNRHEIDHLADQLFAPTALAARNLAEERLAGTVTVTGNSGIDALHFVLDRLAADELLRARCDAELPERAGEGPLILATVHRREAIGDRLDGICTALASIAFRGIARIVLPVHPNPAFRSRFEDWLGPIPGIHLVKPLSLPAMVRMMQRADLILTDSGGVQEEAPSLGKPVLVLRDVTERPEAVSAGLAVLAGTTPERIIAETQAALERIAAMRAPAWPVAQNPYGDGRAAMRIVAGLLGERVVPFESGLAAPSGAPLRLAS